MGENLPAISVVMPLYNKEHEVGRAVQSVLAQTFSDYELLVVDDGSTDKGPDVVAAWNEPRIRMIRQDNGGVSAARNRGIAEARAGLVAFLDADDEWLPEFLETIIRLRENFPVCRVFATSYMICYMGQPPRLAILRGALPAGNNEGILLDYFQTATFSDPPLHSSAVAVDKKAITEINGFPIGIIAGEDLLTWARLAVRFDIAYCASPLARFYAPQQMSDRPPRIPQQPDQFAQCLSEILNIVPIEKRQSLTEYLALWHRMRAVVFIMLNQGIDARLEIRNASSYIGMNIRLQVLNIISKFPGTLPSRAQRLASKIMHMIRSF
jgi:glycosyltransferase involved in cell wall biosynthesis